MLMWFSGFVVVPAAMERSGVPFLVLGLVLLALGLRAFMRAGQKSPSEGALRRWVGGLGAEEAIVGGLTGPVVGISQAWRLSLGIDIPEWGPWLVLGTGVALMIGASRPVLPCEWLLPVRGRWRRMALAALGLTCLYAAGPCWFFFLQLWQFEQIGASGPLLLAARAACVVLTGIVLLYSLAFVLWLGERREATTGVVAHFTA